MCIHAGKQVKARPIATTGEELNNEQRFHNRRSLGAGPALHAGAGHHVLAISVERDERGAVSDQTAEGAGGVSDFICSSRLF